MADLLARCDVEVHEGADQDAESTEVGVARELEGGCRVLRKIRGSGDLALSLTETSAEALVVVLACVRLCVRVSTVLAEERTAAGLDRKLTHDRVTHEHHPGERVDQHRVGLETLHEQLSVHREDVVGSEGAVVAALHVAASGRALHRDRPGVARRTRCHRVVEHNGAE